MSTERKILATIFKKPLIKYKRTFYAGTLLALVGWPGYISSIGDIKTVIDTEPVVENLADQWLNSLTAEQRLEWAAATLRSEQSVFLIMPPISIPGFDPIHEKFTKERGTFIDQSSDNAYTRRFEGMGNFFGKGILFGPLALIGTMFAVFGGMMKKPEEL